MKKMKKVLFLMVLLFLLVLGTAGVKAQVRIGGNGAPNAAAILDLNADDAVTGTKGLALPRVSLTNVSTPLTGTPVVNGMMIYNTNAFTTGGSGIGIYYWTADNSKWVKVINSDFTVPIGKIETIPADSGLVLMSNGSTLVWKDFHEYQYIVQSQSVSTASYGTVTWTKIFDANIPIDTYVPPGYFAVVPATGVNSSDFCTSADGKFSNIVSGTTGAILLRRIGSIGSATGYAFHVRCYRPSI
jgi:hypothetical protein